MRSRPILLAVLFGGALLGVFAFRTTPSASQTSEAASYVGSEACAECHEGISHALEIAGHGRAVKDADLIDGKVGCESCHGPGSLHAAAGGDKDAPGFSSIKRIDKMKPEEANAVCTSCHNGAAQMHWADSKHADRGVTCVNCHSIHEPKDPSRKMMLKAANTSQLCLTCHKTKRMQLARSAHMPVLEGGMDCASCHNPHGSPTPRSLKANSVNELCENCHADKRGPMLFEHAPVRENCVTCHEPHGANNQRSLASKTPFLCQRCHVASRHPSTLYDGPDLTSNRLFNRSCLNCHSQIHGSNHPSGKYLMR